MIRNQFRCNPEVERQFPRFYPFLEGVINARLDELSAAAASASAFRANERDRRVWLYWGQGWDQAPILCHVCKDSWNSLNKHYNINLIDYTRSVDMFAGLSVERQIYQPRVKANVLRLRLLLRYGGVWADPTVFCARPLETWLPFCSADSNLFMFSFRPGGDRSIANWFIKGSGSSCLLALWSALYEAYLEELVRQKVGLHAYFVQHYIFDVARQLSDEAAREWIRMPKLPPGAAGGALGALIDGKADPSTPLSEPDHRRIARLLTEIPIHKLSWKGRAAAGGERVAGMLDALRRYAGTHAVAGA